MACGEIRDNVRSSITEFRQLSRDKVLINKRKALQDVVDLGRDVNDAEVELISDKLKKKSAVQIDDLALLKLAFVQNASNIIAFLKVKGALHALVRELSSSKSSYQLVAAECFCNLALGDAKSCLQVAKAAGPYLVALLSSCNNSLTSVSVWTLGNLVGSGERTWRVVHSQGFLGKLLELIAERDLTLDIPASADVQENAFSALVQLLRVGIKNNLLTEEEVVAVAKTVASLKHSSGKNVRVSEFLLSSLTSADHALLEGKVHLKCLRFVGQTELTDETVASFTPALRTVANLIAEPSGSSSVDIFAEWGLLRECVQKVFSSPYPHLVDEVGWLLGNLLNHPAPQVQLVLEDLSLDFKLFKSQYEFFSS